MHHYMTTRPALLSHNLIGWSSGRIAPSCPMDQAARQKALLVNSHRICGTISFLAYDKLFIEEGGGGEGYI